MWSKLSMGHCSLQRWWLVVTQPNGQSREKLSEILKRASQLICSVPAGQETDKITAVYSWSSHIKCNYLECSAMFSAWHAGTGLCPLHQRRLGLGMSTPQRAETLHLRLVRNKAPCPSPHLTLLHSARVSVPTLFSAPSGIFFLISCCFPARRFVRG